MRMANDDKGVLTAGARLVCRRWGLLWWIFAVNIVLGALGTLPAARQLHNTVRHTLAGEHLYRGFDVGMFYELVRVPEVGLLRFTTSSYLLAGLFLFFMLFVSGGILETYRQGRRRISTSDFFAVSGIFFWRFVRLTLISLVLFVVLGNAYLGVDKVSDYLGDRAVADQVGFAIWLVGVIILVLLVLFVRLWFDLAKVRAVAQNERRMLQNTLKSLDSAQRGLRPLLWMYLRISLVAWMAALVAFLIWMKVPPTAIWATFILLELVVFVQLGARLWQMAALTVWYKRHVEAVPAHTVDFATPKPEEVIEPEPQLTLYPETELPPSEG
jgi:hypothetical protein